MPKKFPSKVDKLYSENVKQKFDQVTQNQKNKQIAAMGMLNTFLSNFYPPNSPESHMMGDFVTGFTDTVLRHQDQKDKVTSLERDIIASRLKEECGVKLGFREKFRLYRNEKKLAKLMPQMQRANNDLTSYYAYAQQMSQNWLPIDPRHQYLEGVKAVFEDAPVTPGVEMLDEAKEHMADATEAIGYELQYTKEETKDFADNIEELESAEELENQGFEGVEDTVDALEGDPVAVPKENPNLSFSDLSGIKQVDSFPPPAKKPVDLGIKSPTAQVGNQGREASPAHQQQQQHKVGSKGFTDLTATTNTKELG